MFGLFGFASDKFQLYQFLTHIFIHAGFSHILHNMLPLIFIGPWLERLMSSNRFLTFYMICGLGASFLYAGINYVEYKQLEAKKEAFLENPTPAALDLFIMEEAQWAYSESAALREFVYKKFAESPNNAEYITEAKAIVSAYTARERQGVPLVGASGAVFGILMAFMLIFPNLEMMMLFIPIPIKAKYLIGAYALFEIYSLVQNRPDDNVAHLAHLGGMVFAFILVKFWKIKQVY
jgi:membrane associated rhomboid family serine protease